ncbi:hypothetical protein LSH36_204g02035 [Paralvinella palmiformis]|uniref:Kinesin motor domain-containing protein n=1 Tax=Paralvinella palmiformis TaxID=53620 RepID=A0AAD9JPE8_9ANNE|nr:hypothetical protein LSH36_204g02035 [Paralvinella palmiformis]
MSKVKVAVRVRPPTQRELEIGNRISVQLHEDKRTGSANVLRVHNAKVSRS